jgi:hypothetical protein
MRFVEDYETRKQDGSIDGKGRYSTVYTLDSGVKVVGFFTLPLASFHLIQR